MTVSLEVIEQQIRQASLSQTWLHKPVVVRYKSGRVATGIVRVIDAKTQQAWIEITPGFGWHLPVSQLELAPTPDTEPRSFWQRLSAALDHFRSH